jgi:DtxR family transcriptional regulator, Mn-dependent transcriptional regulator
MTVQKDNLSSSLEDYLEAIYNLAGDNNVTRSRDIAEQLGVSRASVTGALRALKEKKMVNYQPYDYISLTKTGQIAAAEVAGKHEILKSFFIDILDVKREIAQQAACKAEHTLGSDIITKLLCFIEFVGQDNKNGYDMIEKFKIFCLNRKKQTRK